MLDGQIDASGITDPVKREYLEKRAAKYLSEYQSMMSSKYSSYSDEIQAKSTSLKRHDKLLADARREFAKLPANDPRRAQYQEAISKAQKERDDLQSDITDSEKWRSSVFLTEPSKLVKGISDEVSASSSAKAAFSSSTEGETPFQAFQKGYLKLVQDTEDMKRRGDFDASYLDQVGQSFREFLDWESLGLDLSKEEQEYLANKRIISSLTPIFLNNNLGVTEQSGDFVESFLSGMGSFINPQSGNRRNQTQVVSDQLGYLRKEGFNSDSFNDAKVTEKMEDRITEVPWYSAESTGQIGGTVSAVILDLGLSNAIVVNPAMSLASKSKNLKALGKAYDGALDSTKLGRFVKPSIAEGAKFEVAGNLIGSAEEELNFESGLIGSLGGNLVKSTVSKLPAEKMAGWTQSIFGSKTPEAMEAFKKIGNANARGLGEVAEETTQELIQIYNSELEGRGFWEEVESRFGSYNDIMKFVVSSYVMGSAFSFSESSDVKTKYDSLTDEQKQAVDQVKSEIDSDIADGAEAVAEKTESIKDAEDAVREATPKEQVVESLKKDLEFEKESEFGGNEEIIANLESQISELEAEEVVTEDVAEEVAPLSENINIVEEEGKDTEYKVDGGFFNEKDFISKLEDPDFVAKIDNGEVTVEVQNPSDTVSQILTPSPTVQESQGIEAPKPVGETMSPKKGAGNSYQKKFMANSEVSDSKQAIKREFISGARINKSSLSRELALDKKGGSEVNQRKGFFTPIKGKKPVDIDDMVQQLKAVSPEVFTAMDDNQIRQEIIDVMMDHNSIADVESSFRDDISVEGVMYQNIEDRVAASMFEEEKYSALEGDFEEEIRTDAEIAEMTPEAFDQSDKEFNEYINSLTDEQIEAEFGKYEPKEGAVESTEGKESPAVGEQKDVGGEVKKPARESEPAKPRERKPVKGPEERVSKQTARAAAMEQDPAVKKKLESIGKYKTQTFDQVSRYVDDIIETLGSEAAIDYARSESVAPDMKVAVLTEAGATVVQEANAELKKAQDKGDIEAERVANEKALKGYDSINQASQIKTKAGQVISYTRNTYKKFPSVFLMEQMTRFEGSNKGVLDEEYSVDSEGNAVTAQEEITQLQERMNDQIDSVVSKKMDEILSRLDKAESENKSLMDEIEKLKKERDTKLGTKKQRVQKAKKKRSDAIAKLKKGKNSGELSMTILGLNNTQMEAIFDIIASYIEEGVLRTDVILTKTLNDVRTALDNKKVTKDHIRNMAVQIDEFNAMVQGEIESGEKTAKDILRGEDLKEIVKSHYKGRHSYARTLAQTIMANTELDADSAQAIALAIEDELKAEIDAMVDKELRKMLLNDRESMAELKKARKKGTITENQEAEIEKRLTSSENRKIHKKIVDAINMGALGRTTDIQRAFEAKFGFRSLPDAVKSRLNSIADRLGTLERDIEKEIYDADGNVVRTINTRHVEEIGKLQKEFNTLLESQKKMNLPIFLREVVSWSYVSMLSGPLTFARAFIGGYGSGFMGTLAYNMMNVTNLRALGSGYKAAVKSIPAAWSRARTARKTGYDFFGESALKGDYNSASQGRVERALFTGLGDAVNSGNVPKIILKSIGQGLKVIHALGALDAFMVTVSGSFVGATEEVKAHRRAHKKNPSMNQTVAELLQRKDINEADYKSIAEEEYTNIENDIKRDVNAEIKAGRLKESQRNSEIDKRLRQEFGIRGSYASPKRTYKTRRVQELRENDMERHFEEGAALAKDASLMGTPDGLVGLAVSKVKPALAIKADDTNFTAVMKFLLNGIFKFVRITGQVANKSFNNIPVLGIANAFLGPGYNPVTGEFDTNFIKGKARSNPLVLKQRIATNLIVTSLVLAAVNEMFKYDEEEEEYVLDPDRRIDIRGFGYGGMGGAAKNRRMHENWENISISFTKDENGKFTDYYGTRLIPEIASVAATTGAFADDMRGDGDPNKIWARKDRPATGYTSKIITNNARLFTESSFSSTGRIFRNFMMKEDIVDAIAESAIGVLVDNIRPTVNPSVASSVTKYIQAANNVSQKDGNRVLQGMYGLDSFLKNDRTDVFGHPYPVENDVDRFIVGVKEKDSEKYEKTVGLLYKFDKGLDVSKWNTKDYEYGGTFKIKGSRGEFRSKDENIASEILKIQEDKFRELVESRYESLDKIEDRDILNKAVKKIQTASKNYAEGEMIKKYFDRDNPSKGKIVLVGS